MALLESGRLTVSGGQFDWGGHLKYGARRQQCWWKHLAICWDLRPLHSMASVTVSNGRGAVSKSTPLQKRNTESGCHNLLVRTISREVASATPQRLYAGHPCLGAWMMIESELMGDHQPSLQKKADRRRNLKKYATTTNQSLCDKRAERNSPRNPSWGCSHGSCP